nr:hypothetical protein [Escherichia coli]
MTSLKTSIKTITYLSDIGCLEIQGASLANQHAKQQIALESQRTQEDIKVAVADDDCAVRIVPSGAVKRLHEYANGIRVGAGRSVTSQSDG